MDLYSVILHHILQPLNNYLCILGTTLTTGTHDESSMVFYWVVSIWLFNISMMLNKCIFRWFWFDVTTKALFFAFFQFFSTKNAENEDFDQRLGCAAPKRWLKYTTTMRDKNYQWRLLASNPGLSMSQWATSWTIQAGMPYLTGNKTLVSNITSITSINGFSQKMIFVYISSTNIDFKREAWWHIGMSSAS